MAKNRVLETWLDNSKKINTELAEDPEARAAAQAIAKGELGEPDNPHIDPTQDEPADTGEDEGEKETSEEKEAAKEAAAAAEGAEKEGKEPEVADDDRQKELKAAKAERDRLRRERDEGRRQLAEARRRVAEFEQQRQTTQPATREEPKKEIDDPEPNRDTHPLEHTDWQVRQADRRAAAAEARAQGLEERFNRFERSTGQDQASRTFDSLMSREKDVYRETDPDFDSKMTFLRELLRREYTEMEGMPASQAEVRLQNEERAFLVRQTKAAYDNGEPESSYGAYALERLAKMAEIRGWHKEDAANGNGSGSNGTSKPRATQKPEDKIKDNQERQRAARAASTMGGSPAETRDPNKRMTADEYLAMSATQRAAYRKKNPSWLDQTFGEGEDGGRNPLLIGRP